MKIKRFFYDVETTGVDFRKNSIHQFGAIIEIDGKIVEEIDLRMRPHPKATIEEQALKAGNVTLEQIMAYPEWLEQFRVLKNIMKEYVDPYDNKDKFNLIGFNSNYFDNNFFTMLFDLAKDNSFWSYFWGGPIDVMCLASERLIEERTKMPSFKLHRVAKTLGIKVDKEKLHDSTYDVHLTREIYLNVTDRDIL